MEMVTKISFMFLSVEISLTIPTCKPFMITGLEDVRPCTLVYFAYMVMFFENIFFPFRKLKPKIRSVITIAPNTPTFVSFVNFTLIIYLKAHIIFLCWFLLNDLRFQFEFYSELLPLLSFQLILVVLFRY